MNLLGQKITLRRILGMIAGVVIIGIGIAVFKFSRLGNDSISALNLRLAELVGLPFSIENVLMNLCLFVPQLLWGRRYIGLGTIINSFCIGFIVTFTGDAMTAVFGSADTLPVQLLWVAVAVLVIALGCSLYQTADLGVAPYDALSLMLADRLPVPYFGCRVFTDALCAVLAFLLGGLIGLGTLICAFGLGPFVQFFTRHFRRRCCGTSRRRNRSIVGRRTPDGPAALRLPQRFCGRAVLAPAMHFFDRLRVPAASEAVGADSISARGALPCISNKNKKGPSPHPETVLFCHILMIPNALATELARMTAAKTGQSQRIMKRKILLRRKGWPSSSTSCSILSTPMTRETSRQVAMAAIGIMTEFVRKSKKSRNCIPMTVTPASGP